MSHSCDILASNKAGLAEGERKATEAAARQQQEEAERLRQAEARRAAEANALQRQIAVLEAEQRLRQAAHEEATAGLRETQAQRTQALEEAAELKALLSRQEERTRFLTEKAEGLEAQRQALERALHLSEEATGKLQETAQAQLQHPGHG